MGKIKKSGWRHSSNYHLEYLAQILLEECLRELTLKNLSNVSGSGYNHAFEKLGVEVVAIDGKTHRGSYDRTLKLKALHTVSARST